DRSPELELVTRPEFVDEVRRDLAVVEPLDGQEQPGVLRTGRDRVAALRLIAVLGGQPDIDVLPGTVAGPRRRLEPEARAPTGFVDEFDDLRVLPVQSPW